MMIGKIVLRDVLGWPVETVKGKSVFNFIRIILLTDINRTWKQRKQTDQENK